MKGFLYGYTDSSKGEFTFKAEEAWMIEGGRLTDHLREVAVSRLTLEVLGKIDAIADDVIHQPGLFTPYSTRGFVLRRSRK